jgi:hypothetical protein
MNTYTDPKLLDVSSALLRLPKLQLDGWATTGMDHPKGSLVDSTVHPGT